MKRDDLIRERNALRFQWHDVRKKRLEFKSISIVKDCESSEMKSTVRQNSNYKKLKKEQKHISTMIRHVENKIRRGRKNDA